MSHGVPRTSREVVREARRLGYQYDYATGGHVFYTKINPDTSIGQSAKLCIPTDIKSEKTLRNILKGMAYFAANDLNHAGAPLREDPAIAEERLTYKANAEFARDQRAWKQEMKRHLRGIADYPGEEPVRPNGPKPG